jgi:hypothetical protein
MNDYKNKKTNIDQSLLDAFYKITPDIFYKYLLSKGVSSLICPVCNHDKIGVMATIGGHYHNGEISKKSYTYVESRKITGIYGVMSETNNLGDFYYPMHCGNCGYTQWFSAMPIIAWIEHGDIK